MNHCKFRAAYGILNIAGIELHSIPRLHSITDHSHIIHLAVGHKRKIIVDHGQSSRRQRINQFKLGTLHILYAFE